MVTTKQVKSIHTIRTLAGLPPESRENLSVDGMIHSVRDMGGFAFVILRCPGGLLQCVYDKTGGEGERILLRDETSVRLTGDLKDSPKAPNGMELLIKEYGILSSPKEELPVDVSKKKLNVTLDKEIGLRPVTLRSARNRAIFKLSEGVVQGMRRYWEEHNFTEIFTPKLVAEGAEGGTNIFSLDYFGRKAYLAQSPQLYKQMLVPVYGRVFEVAPIFRAEKHDTARHLNECISIDLEMGFIDSFYDVTDMIAATLRSAFAYVQAEYGIWLKELNIEMPEVGDIPCIRFKEAKERVSEKYNRKSRDPFDLEPEEERLISQLVKEEYGGDFAFVTHYPTKKRAFYTMDDPDDSTNTLSFDLLFRGIEISSGAQRIHDYDIQVEKMRVKGLDPDSFKSYLMLHKYGCPPHGGMGMGLERVIMKLAEEKNIRSTTMFPRDTLRLEP